MLLYHGGGDVNTLVLKGFLGEVRALSGEEFLSCPTESRLSMGGKAEMRLALENSPPRNKGSIFMPNFFSVSQTRSSSLLSSVGK